VQLDLVYPQAIAALSGGLVMRNCIRHGRRLVGFGAGIAVGLLIAIPAALSIASWPESEINPQLRQGRLDSVLALAESYIRFGNVATARQLLLSREETEEAPVLFALAETYDPNMLAAWNARGIMADASRAVALYRRAVELGLHEAERRIAWLE
jgi:hypothetical protein